MKSLRHTVFAASALVITATTLVGCTGIMGDDNTVSTTIHDVTPSVRLHNGVQPYEGYKEIDTPSSGTQETDIGP